jgi:hypothetical protein
MPGSTQWSLFLRFPHQNPIHASLLPIRATCPAHLILLDFITRTILGEEYRSWSSPITLPFVYKDAPCVFLHSIADLIISEEFRTLWWSTNTIYWIVSTLARLFKVNVFKY